VTLKELLEKRGITGALIVDDACDAAPHASDLADQADQWSIFAQDLEPEQRALIDNELPDGVSTNFGERIGDDRYVETIWKLRDQLGNVAGPVFETYDQRQITDMAYVDAARKVVEGLGLTCTTAGREFEDEAAEAQLILIDLYLGGTQNEAALDESMRRLTDVVNGRRDNPPLVILMSRSNQLQNRRDRFRDEVGLIESGFRILPKNDLKIAGRLEVQIERLADSQPETLKLARFFAALEGGISQAADRTLQVMRRLTLSDIAQIQQLLLDAEEAPAGSYLVDVFDRVLQHEVEREEAIIASALELNDLTPDRHPPAFVAGSLELQDLVRRTLTQASERLRLPGTPHSKVTFGDLLRVRKVSKRRKGVKGVIWPTGVTEDSVFLVLTPICDLQHGQSPRLLLLVGEAQELGRDDWAYKGDTRTPAITIDDKLVWIKWDLKHVDTVAGDVLDEATEDGRVELVARLRESHALELQQAVLAGLGRVGLLAPMPANFKVSIDAYVTDVDRKVVALDVPELSDGGVIWSGRDKNANTVKKLVLRETPSDALQDKLAEMDPKNVAPEARGILKQIQNSRDLPSVLTRGVDITKMSTGSWFAAKRLEGATSTQPFLLLGYDSDIGAELSRQDAGRAGVVLVVRAGDAQADVALQEVIRSGPAEKPNKASRPTSTPATAVEGDAAEPSK
jgi:hypothetical protein